MKALLLIDKKKPIAYQEVYYPQTKETQVIVELKAAALNHRDLVICQGQYPFTQLHTILGSDGAGTYQGQDVLINPGYPWKKNSLFQPEDYQIIGMPEDGTFAEYVAVEPAQIHAMPPHLSHQEAAALPTAALAAYRALFTKGQLKKGEKVLISGIGGGIGMFAYQFAVAAGAEVYITSGSDDKLETAILMGAKGGANYTAHRWSRDLWLQTGGFDLMIDAAGGSGFLELVHLAAPGGRIIVLGSTKGYFSKLNPNKIFKKQISLIGSYMGSNEEFAQMLAFVKLHQLKPHIDSVFALQDGAQAMERMRQGLHIGKIVLEIGA